MRWHSPPERYTPLRAHDGCPAPSGNFATMSSHWAARAAASHLLVACASGRAARGCCRPRLLLEQPIVLEHERHACPSARAAGMSPHIHAAHRAPRPPVGVPKARHQATPACVLPPPEGPTSATVAPAGTRKASRRASAGLRRAGVARSVTCSKLDAQCPLRVRRGPVGDLFAWAATARIVVHPRARRPRPIMSASERVHHLASSSWW